MSISSISATPAPPIKISVPVQNAVSSSVSATSAAQEVTETPAVTKAEAAKGDQQAVRKLAQEQNMSSSQGSNKVSNIQA
jgi:hypothetical protein